VDYAPPNLTVNSTTWQIEQFSTAATTLQAAGNVPGSGWLWTNATMHGSGTVHDTQTTVLPGNPATIEITDATAAPFQPNANLSLLVTPHAVGAGCEYSVVYDDVITYKSTTNGSGAVVSSPVTTALGETTLKAVRVPSGIGGWLLTGDDSIPAFDDNGIEPLTSWYAPFTQSGGGAIAANNHVSYAKAHVTWKFTGH
jgi:hypothetical protein